MRCGHCGEHIFAFQYWLWTKRKDGIPIHEFLIVNGRLECDPYDHVEEREPAEVVEFPHRDEKSAAS